MSLQIENNDPFWSKIESLKCEYTPGKPIIVKGKVIFDNATTGQEMMFASCNYVAPIARRCFEANPKTVIDLGCGTGCNSIMFLAKGIKVVAYDNKLSLLQIFQKSVPQSFIPNITLRRGDITTCKSYTKEGELVDAVLCVDVLPYLEAKDLRNTLEKIKESLLPGGALYGTLFVKKSFSPDVELLSKLGATFIDSPSDAKEILTRSGFELISFEQCVCKGEYQNSYQFVAKKIM